MWFWCWMRHWKSQRSKKIKITSEDSNPFDSLVPDRGRATLAASHRDMLEPKLPSITATAVPAEIQRSHLHLLLPTR